LLLFGDDWEEKRRRVFCFSWRKRSQKSKKNEKSLLSFSGLHFLFCHAGNKHEKKKKQFLLAPKLRFPRSVVEKDLEDVHHRGDV
jgi:hypothetical protein